MHFVTGLGNSNFFQTVPFVRNHKKSIVVKPGLNTYSVQVFAAFCMYGRFGKFWR